MTHKTHPIIFLRGLGRESAHWGNFPRTVEAATGRPCVGIDLPGCGSLRHMEAPKSILDIARHVAAHHQWQPGANKSIVGMSLGAMVALELAALAPLEVDALALINTSAKPFARPWERFSAQATMAATRAFPLWARKEPQAMRAVEEAIHMATRASNDGREEVVDEWIAIRAHRAPRRTTVMRQLAAAAAYAPNPPAAGLPILLLNSLGDKVAHPECSARMAKAWGTELATHPWAGHDLPRDDPTWTAERIRDFFQPAKTNHGPAA